MTTLAGGGQTVAGLGALETHVSRTRRTRVWIECPHLQTELDIYWLPLEWPNDYFPRGYNVYRLKTTQHNLQAPNAVKLNTSLITVPMYRDTTVDIRTKEHIYYVVTAEMADGTEMPLGEPVCLAMMTNALGRPSRTLSMPRILAESRRRKAILLRENGEYSEILIRRRSGTRCQCVSCAYQATTNSNCLLCYGTGFYGGYDLLKHVLYRHVPMQELIKILPQGLVATNNPKGWLVDFPLLRNGDIVCRRNGERLEVNNVIYMEHQGILTHQDFELLSIPQTSSVYNYDAVNGETIV